MKEPPLYVDHILKMIRMIETFASSTSLEEFINDDMKYYAVSHSLQTMAESTQRLPKELKDQYAEVPWREISALRNIIVHDYLEGVNPYRIWSIITTELPSLKKVMISIQKDLMG